MDSLAGLTIAIYARFSWAMLNLLTPAVLGGREEHGRAKERLDAAEDALVFVAGLCCCPCPDGVGG